MYNGDVGKDALPMLGHEAYDLAGGRHRDDVGAVPPEHCVGEIGVPIIAQDLTRLLEDGKGTPSSS